jgi:CRISPR-associated protein Csd1
MLELLAQYAYRQGLEPERGFRRGQVRWAIVCSDTGEVLDVIELGEAGARNNRGQWFAKCPDLSQGELVAGGLTRSHFLVDTAAAVALLGVAPGDNKALAKHEFFIMLLRLASDSMPQLASMAEMLSKPTAISAVQARLRGLKAKPGDKVSFKVGEVYPLESSDWHEWWRSFRPGIAGRPENERGSMRCLVTGQLSPPALTHLKIRGLARYGGQPSGDALISFDKAAFTSYGLEQSANAAASEQAVSAYREALNHLIDETGRNVGGVLVVHWFKKRVSRDDDPFPWLQESDEKQELDARSRARELLTSIRTGRRPDLADNHFYALSLNGAAGRVMIRDWMDGQFEVAVENVLRWFEDLEVADLHGNRHMPPGIEQVVTCLLPERKRNQTYDDWTRGLGVVRMALWRSAIRGDAIPYSALARATDQNTMFILSEKLGAEGEARGSALMRRRMGLIKAYHVRKAGRGEGQMGSGLGPYLNEDHPDPAYHCGRLMAALDEIQRAALGEVGAGVVQRYYAAASATPALVLGRLVRTSQYHLDKLDIGRKVQLERIVSSIMAKIKDTIPNSLTLEKQSLFALGFYQQKAARARHGRNADSQNDEQKGAVSDG